MIIVIDYKVGNVESVCNAFDYIGTPARLSSDPERIRAASGLVLPGVAAFGYAMSALGQTGQLVIEQALAGKPLLGICVGHQLLFEASTEHGLHRGLGLIKGQIQPLPKTARVPHMGWNSVELDRQWPIFDQLPKAKHFYFAHSYYSQVTDPRAQTIYTDYGFELPAAVRKDNIIGLQFHPEKSGPQGLRLLENFANMCLSGDQNCQKDGVKSPC